MRMGSIFSYIALSNQQLYQKTVELFKSSEKVKKKDDIKIEKDFIND
jgi:aspartate carbamoyltransferase regulatory subunit